MKFLSTALAGVFIVEIEPAADHRGFFARTWCEREFAERGLSTRLAQSSVSLNTARGTVRGLHFQASPAAEAKLVRCTRGAVFDVAVDLRRDSPTYMNWFAAELTADNHRALYVPNGCAHGFQTLTDGCEVLYLMSEFYRPELARGIRWDDPAIAIRWPIDNPILSDRDRTLPLAT